MSAGRSTLGVLLRAAASSDALALVCGDRSLSYGQLARRVERATAELIARGVGPGDRCLVAMPSSIELVIAVLAIGAAGAISVPLPPKLAADHLARVIAATAPRLSIRLRGQPPIAGLPAWVIEDGDAPVSFALPAPRPDDLAMVVFSSGSTGAPKGVGLAHRHLLAIADYLRTTYRMATGHRELVIAPIYHPDGWQRTAATLLAGGCVVLGDGANILDDVKRLQIQGLFLPPTPLRALLRTDLTVASEALRSCRTIEVGGAPSSPAELRALMRRVPEAQVFVHYGLTECSRALILEARRHHDKLATVGRPGRGVELRLVADGGREAAAGELGEIQLRAPHLIGRYWGQSSSEHGGGVDGWVATGDYASLDADGFVMLAGRRNDMISCAGREFFPTDLELEIGAVAGVEHYICAGVVDSTGQVPWAFVVPDPTTGSPVSRFLEQASQRLPSYMVPRKVVVIPSMPLLPSGHPDRRRTVELYGAAARGARPGELSA